LVLDGRVGIGSTLVLRRDEEAANREWDVCIEDNNKK